LSEPIASRDLSLIIMHSLQDPLSRSDAIEKPKIFIAKIAHPPSFSPMETNRR
jgi:hypothetical protein